MIDLHLIRLIGSIILFLIAVVLHEYMHGWVAFKLGDSTAKDRGRLTLNPIVHIDLIGTVVLPIMLVILKSPVILGWAKPVPINFLNLRHPKKDLFWVALAGPAANIVAAIISTVLLKIGIVPPNSLLAILIINFILINLILAVFNILPIPPLDGSNLLISLLPNRFLYTSEKFYHYGFVILFILLWLGLLDKIIWPAVLVIVNLLGLLNNIH